MKYYVTIEDRTLEIELTDTPEGKSATIEGRTYALDLVPIAGAELFSLIVDNASHEVLVEGEEVTIGGELFHVRVEDEWERRLANIQRKGAVETGEQTIKAPMPGAVVGVQVAEGDAVKRGQGMVILSAMKMENEIRAPRDGKIAVVHVSEGDKVEQNAPLVTIGPADGG